jgi:GH43 family beta-xylosidase
MYNSCQFNPRLFVAIAFLLLAIPATARAQGTFTNPVYTGADPQMTYQNGVYLLVDTNYRGDITVVESGSLSTLNTQPQHSVFQTPSGFESPEIYWMGAPYNKWYIYYTDFNYNGIVVIESDSSNPIGTYHFKAGLVGGVYDGSILQMPGGGLYLMYSTFGHIVVQPMSNPYTMSGGPSNIAAIDQPWESGVIEAPEALWHNGVLFLMYASGAWFQNNYGMGVSRFLGGDPTNAANWSKVAGPLLAGNGGTAFGAGAASPFSSPDGTETWIVYQAFSQPYTGNDDRNLRIQRLAFGGDDTPLAMAPADPGAAIADPSGDPNNQGAIDVSQWYHIVNQNSGKLIGVQNASGAPGANLVQWNDNGTPDHNWELVPLGNGYYHIVNQNSGLLMAVNGASTAPGTQVTQWTNNGTPDHNWQLVPLGNGTYHIVNANSQGLLAVQNASGADGASVTQWYDNGTADHNWQLIPVGSALPIASGRSYHLVNVNSGQFLDNPSGTDVHGTILQQFLNTNSIAQQWTTTNQGGNNWVLSNVAGGLAIDDFGWSTSPGSLIDEWDDWGGAVQQWQILTAGDGTFRLRSSWSGLNLEVGGASLNYAAPLDQWFDNGASCQQWRFQ